MPNKVKLINRLRKGRVYRRSDIEQWSSSIDRELNSLVKGGVLQKLSRGLYYYPKETVFGKAPPEENVLVREFLKDDRFLLTSPNVYNSLGVGTTQLYNQRVVYNHKRHGEFKLGNRKFSFRIKPHFPNKLNEEFLLVDLVNNLNKLAEDQEKVLGKVGDRLRTMDKKKVHYYIARYGNQRTKKTLETLTR
ncbi:DUF6088 family protein [Arachidicoccus sp.]|jgi:hypothetical protein|uniref:DUF6088 family protein n=1 Tax=Arachidicoccus sp. TaxID=1872624 RepID=UPI003D196BE9